MYITGKIYFSTFLNEGALRSVSVNTFLMRTRLRNEDEFEGWLQPRDIKKG